MGLPFIFLKREGKKYSLLLGVILWHRKRLIEWGHSHLVALAFSHYQAIPAEVHISPFQILCLISAKARVIQYKEIHAVINIASAKKRLYFIYGEHFVYGADIGQGLDLDRFACAISCLLCPLDQGLKVLDLNVYLPVCFAAFIDTLRLVCVYHVWCDESGDIPPKNTRICPSKFLLLSLYVYGD